MIEISGVVVAVVIGVAASFLGNQLAAVPHFKGRNQLVLRALLWLVALEIVRQCLALKELSDRWDIPLWCVGTAMVLLLLQDVRRLIAGWRGSARQQPIGAEPARQKADDLREKLLVELRRRVRQRLDYAYGEQAPINTLMVPQQDAVEGGRREGKVYLMPQPKQQLETFEKVGRAGGLRVVLPEETILDTFESEDVAGQLLILGAPGAGKTTVLLRLAEQLLARAEGTDEIPYIFELSAWKDTSQDLVSWMQGQLEFDYGIKPAVSRQWIVDGRLLPLLDGLDELAMTAQKKCVGEINAFVRSELGRRVVVCCRSREYADGGVKLDALNGALRLQPLSDVQIRKYFEDIGRPQIWEGLQKSRGLSSLMESDTEEVIVPARIPLFLQILAVAYQQGKKISTEAELFEAYIERQLSVEVRIEDRRQGGKKKERDGDWAYETVEKERDEVETRRYLNWLARRLEENNSENNFLIERMQPSWLDSKDTKRSYLLVVIFSIVLTLGLLMYLTLMFADSSTRIIILTTLPLSASFILLTLELDLNIISPVESFDYHLLSDLMSDREENPWNGGMLVLVAQLAAILTINLEHSQGGFGTGTLIFFLGCAVVLVVVWVSWLINSLRTDFQAIEFPNQGIIASAKNILLVSFLTYPAGVLLSYVVEYFLGQGANWVATPSTGVVFALLLGLYVGGGIPVIQHAVLRCLLNRQSHIPYNYARFLKYTTERRLTQQIGGRFRFIHRKLLDHFAAMETHPNS